MSILLLSGSLFGCQLLNFNSADNVLVDDLSLQSGNKQDQAIQLAINKLESGDKKSATEIIDRVLRINSKHKTALLLKNMLTQSAKQVFNTERITRYRIKPGDSLGSIAKTWLGHSIYFVSLAKINNIQIPTQIKQGQSIKIPVIESSPMVQREKRRSKANLSLIKNLTDKKKFLKSLSKMSNLFLLDSDLSTLQELHVKALSLFANNSPSLNDRYKMIDSVSRIHKSNARTILNRGYINFINQQKRLLLTDEFMLLVEDQSYMAAANKLIAARQFSPEKNYREEVLSKQESLIEKLHEQAIILRKNQNLDEAIIRWKKILAISPSNKLAKKYYSRTSKLLSKLKQLN